MLNATIDAAGPIGLGTYRLGKQTYGACRTALDLGYRHLDTAALYQNEAAVAQAIADSGIPRAEVFVTSKIPLTAIRSGQIATAAKRSLEQLGAIDLLLLHAPGAAPRSAWETLLKIQTWQNIGDVGVSNFNVQQLQGLALQPRWNQIEISPFLQRRELVEYCDRQNIQIVAHSSLVKGRKLNDARLVAIAQDCGCTPAQLLLAWAIHQGCIVIPRSSKPAHLQENWVVQDIVLSSEILHQLNGLEAGYATHPQHC